MSARPSYMWLEIFVHDNLEYCFKQMYQLSRNHMIPRSVNHYIQRRGNRRFLRDRPSATEASSMFNVPPSTSLEVTCVSEGNNGAVTGQTTPGAGSVPF